MIIYAINVHTGGGKILLDEVIRQIPSDAVEYYFFDARYDYPQSLPLKKIIKVKPNLYDRIKAEFTLKRLSSLKFSKNLNSDFLNRPEPDYVDNYNLPFKYDQILMFGNLPPLLKQNRDVVVYIQNVLLFIKSDIVQFPFKIKLRIAYEKLWQKLFISNASEIWVQSENVKKIVQEKFSSIAAKVFPIFPLEIQGKPIDRGVSNSTYDFIYVASCDPHKNIERLLHAFKFLEAQNKKPSLLLILTNECDFITQFLDMNSSLNVTVKVKVPYSEIKKYYQSARCLVYPSLFESFGLPLLEAKKYGLKIIASDLDYVKVLRCADEVFDPLSVQSISKSLLNYCTLGTNNIPS